MYSEKLVECRDCGDRFKIVFDSRKEQQDEYTCKCGNLICYPDHWGSFSYKRGGNYRKLSYQDEKHKYEYYEEDYIRLTDEEQMLMNDIGKIGKEFGEGYSSPYENRSNENRIQLELGGCNKQNEYLVIKLKVYLQSDGNPWSDDEIQKQHKRIMTGLNRFKDIIIKVKNNEISLNSPRKIWDDDSLEWHDGTKTQQELYDYELCC